MQFRTRAIHVGNEPDPATGAVIKAITGLNSADGLTFNATTGKLYAGSNNGGFYTIL